MSEHIKAGDIWLQEIADEMRKAKEAGALPSPKRLTVREFIGKFKYYRRSQLIVSHIRGQLKNKQIHTLPDFEFEHIDNEISIALDAKEETPDVDTESISRTFHVSSLKAANMKPCSVSPNDTIAKAITIMLCNNFSQLPVMTTETKVKGAISWRSIGKAYSYGSSPDFVKDCMEGSPREVRLTSTFEELTREIINHDYVLVRGNQNEITGIVTATDLVHQFKELALPFLLIGEIELHLRNLMRGKFETQQLGEISEDDREIKGPDDLAFGGYCKLLQEEQSWNQLQSNLDRREFVRRLEEIREIRNDVMHFSPDGVEPENLEKLQRFAEFLREYENIRDKGR